MVFNLISYAPLPNKVVQTLIRRERHSRIHPTNSSSIISYISTFCTNYVVKHLYCALQVVCLVSSRHSIHPSVLCKVFYTPQAYVNFSWLVKCFHAGCGGLGAFNWFSKKWYTFDFSHLRWAAHIKYLWGHSYQVVSWFITLIEMGHSISSYKRQYLQFW